MKIRNTFVGVLFVAFAIAVHGGEIRNASITGAVAGAAVGAVVGHNSRSGDTGKGAAIGAASGALLGAIVGQNQVIRTQRSQSQQQGVIIREANSVPDAWRIGSVDRSNTVSLDASITEAQAEAAAARVEYNLALAAFQRASQVSQQAQTRLHQLSEARRLLVVAGN